MRRKTALSSEEEGETSSDDDDDDDEEEEEEEEEELENRRRKGGRGRGKLPSKETIQNAFEELCNREAGKKEGEDGFTLQNLLDLCAKYGYHDWTLAEIENMLDAYDLSEARGEKKISSEKEKDPFDETTKTVVVTERGFLEIVRKCGVREL